MGLRDVLANFLSSEGSQDRAGRDDASDGSTTDDAQGSEDASSPPESGFDVELEELDQEEQVEALEGRLDDMESSMQQNQTELETIRGSQQDVAEQLNEVNDTVRQLLGIYDQLTADVNPFMEGPTRDADPDAEGFGVVGGEEADPESEVVEAVVEGDAADDAADAQGDDEDEMVTETVTAAQDDAASEDAATIGLDDLRAEHEAGEDEHDGDPDGVASPADGTVAGQDAADGAVAGQDAAGGAVAAPADSTDAADAAVVSEDEPGDNEIEVEPTGGESMSQHDQFEDGHSDPDPNAGAWREDDTGATTGDATPNDADAPPESSVALAELADTYATEIIVFEWLTSLVSTAGPAATLRAIAYYEEIGWVGPEVKRYLEGVLSGPDLDMNVDPSREPNELTAEDHAESYEYIMKLDAVQRTIDDTGL